MAGLDSALRPYMRPSASEPPCLLTRKADLLRVVSFFSRIRPEKGFLGRGRIMPRWLSVKFNVGRFLELGFPAAATSSAEDPSHSDMPLEKALSVLRVAEEAPFEEILKARHDILGKHSGNQEIATQVEAAYDVLLMQSLRLRRSGKVLDSSIRYADARKSQHESSWMNIGGIGDTLSRLPVDVISPSPDVAGVQTIAFAALMAWTYAGGLPSHVPTNVNGDVPGLIWALGFCASLYFFRKQNVELGKAVSLTMAGVVTGVVVGEAVEAWLQVDLVPVLGISSPPVVVSEFVLASLWLSSLYLR